MSYLSSLQLVDSRHPAAQKPSTLRLLSTGRAEHPASQSHWPTKSSDSRVKDISIIKTYQRSRNLSLTVLYLGLMQLVATGRVLGARFHLLLDNTSADNKNNEMIFFLAWLVYDDIFEETTAFMMIKGHTYSRIDQAFRTMIVQIMAHAVWTISSLLYYLFKFLAPYNCLGVEELPHVWNWSEWFAPHVHTRLGGFATSQFGSGMHEFRCRKNSKGEVRAWFRKSSQASNWLPEDGGMPIFKSRPEGQPPVAMAGSDRSWNRAAVESNLTAWYKYMDVSQSDSVKIRAEWDARFAALPPDGDTTELPPASKLQWANLPKRRETAPHTMDNGPTYVSNALENPPINPVTGYGRTSADVAREVQSHRAFVRRGAAAAGAIGHPPVFQADFLFVKLKGQDVQLHRVVHDMALEDATVENISFATAEYVHEPQEGYEGFLVGTFKPKLNPVYNPATKNKTGGKFIRHKNVMRDSVVLYDVEVVLIKVAGTETVPAHSVVQVTRESLLRLEAAHPACPFPDPDPPPHTPQLKTRWARQPLVRPSASEGGVWQQNLQRRMRRY